MVGNELNMNIYRQLASGMYWYREREPRGSETSNFKFCLQIASRCLFKSTLRMSGALLSRGVGMVFRTVVSNVVSLFLLPCWRHRAQGYSLCLTSEGLCSSPNNI